jgi:hypothetical protein
MPDSFESIEATLTSPPENFVSHKAAAAGSWLRPNAHSTNDKKHTFRTTYIDQSFPSWGIDPVELLLPRAMSSSSKTTNPKSRSKSSRVGVLRIFEKIREHYVRSSKARRWERTKRRVRKVAEEAVHDLESDIARKRVREILNKFYICDASLSGIGRGRSETLARHGFSTAADIQSYPFRDAILQGVPGIGKNLSRVLRSWASDLETAARREAEKMPIDRESTEYRSELRKRKRERLRVKQSSR